MVNTRKNKKKLEIEIDGQKYQMNWQGRPSKYDESITPDKVIEYCKNSIDSKIVPDMAECALFLGIGISTLYEWIKAHPRFAEAIDILKTLQRSFLVKGGLMGDLSAVMSMFLLKNNHNQQNS